MWYFASISHHFPREPVLTFRNYKPQDEELERDAKKPKFEMVNCE